MIQKAIHQLVERADLDFDTTKAVMDEIMSGEATQAQISSFLTALRMKGETIDEITACATVMRDKAVKLNLQYFHYKCIRGSGRRNSCGKTRKPQRIQ